MCQRRSVYNAYKLARRLVSTCHIYLTSPLVILHIEAWGPTHEILDDIVQLLHMFLVFVLELLAKVPNKRVIVLRTDLDGAEVVPRTRTTLCLHELER